MKGYGTLKIPVALYLLIQGYVFAFILLPTGQITSSTQFVFQLYVLLLALEDAFDPQAIEAAVEAATARALRDPPDPEPEPEKPPPEELIQRITSVLIQSDKIYGFMGIRKGKVGIHFYWNYQFAVHLNYC